MDETELIINLATLIAKDYVMDNNVFSDVIKVNKRKMAMINNDKINTTGKVNADDDLDIFFYKKYFLNKDTINNFQPIEINDNDINNIENDNNDENKISIVTLGIDNNYNDNDNDNNNISIIELDDDEEDDIITTPTQQLQAQCKRRCQDATVELKNCPLFEFLRDCDDYTFECQFKLTRKTFEALQQKLNPYLNSYLNYHIITKVHMLLIVLWILTTDESLQSIADRFNILKSTCYKIFLNLCSTIIKHKKLFVSWPEKEQYPCLSKAFNNYLDNNNNNNNSNATTITASPPLNIIGVIGYIDIEFESIFNNEISPTSIKLQCICDANGKFLDVCTILLSKSSNMNLFNSTPIKLFIAKYIGNSSTYHIIGDESYPLKLYLMKPFVSSKTIGENPNIQLYNKVLHSKILIIQRAFNCLRERFKKLQNLRMDKLKDIIHCIEVACAFHNFCVDQNDTYNLKSKSYGTNVNENDKLINELLQKTKICYDDSNANEFAAIKKRVAIVNLIATTKLVK